MVVEEEVLRIPQNKIVVDARLQQLLLQVGKHMPCALVVLVAALVVAVEEEVLLH
jgi:hypothetical protein